MGGATASTLEFTDDPKHSSAQIVLKRFFFRLIIVLPLLLLVSFYSIFIIFTSLIQFVQHYGHTCGALHLP